MTDASVCGKQSVVSSSASFFMFSTDSLQLVMHAVSVCSEGAFQVFAASYEFELQSHFKLHGFLHV